jgi:hypothetical protein
VRRVRHSAAGLILATVLLLGAGPAMAAPAGATPAERSPNGADATRTSADRGHGNHDDRHPADQERADRRPTREGADGQGRGGAGGQGQDAADGHTAGGRAQLAARTASAGHRVPAKGPAPSKSNPPAAIPAAVATTPGTGAAAGDSLSLPVGTPLAAVSGEIIRSIAVEVSPSGSANPGGRRQPSAPRPAPSWPYQLLTPASAFLAPLFPEVGAAGLRAATHSSIPIALAGVVLLLLVIQAQIDKRDPKVARAPTHRGDDGMTFK